MPRVGISCSWCHTMNYVQQEPWPFCKECGHRADKPRMLCDCKKCQENEILVAAKKLMHGFERGV